MLTALQLSDHERQLLALAALYAAEDRCGDDPIGQLAAAELRGLAVTLRGEAPPPAPSPAQGAEMLVLGAGARLLMDGWRHPNADGDGWTLAEALLGARGVEWPELLAEPLRGAWDALTLAAAGYLGLRIQPRGLGMVDALLGWESSAGSVEDVRELLTLAASYARGGATVAPCSWGDRSELPARHPSDCECGGRGVLELAADRWSGFAVRREGGR